jgi:serine/threonine protein kinase
VTFIDDARVRRLVELAAEPRLVADRFEVGTLLGEGGMGSVFEAWDREAKRSVALKLVHDVDEATNARFEREAAALALLSHPGIVGYVAHGNSATGERYLAMERLVGVTLAARLAAGPLGVLDAARIGQGVAAALAAAHECGLVHRDIKPSNVFLEDGTPDRIKLLDFGLARGKGTASVTRQGSLVGTPSYMAPEQVRATGAPDARADLFALGAVLFECLTGRAPFLSADTEGVLLKILVEQAPAVRELCPAAPPAFERLIAQLLSEDPARRPRSAAEVARELGAFLAEQHADTAPVAVAGDLAPEGTPIAGKYRVVRTLGSGGMGIVLLARHEALERNVAIKLLRGSGNGKRSSGEARLLREAQAVSRLESEHVARVMDVGTREDGAPFIVMEFLSGKDLGQLLLERKRLPVGLVVDYVLQAADALAEAHALGIVHRDLKPSNLFLTTRRDGSPLIKLLDFGISKLSSASGAARAELFPSEASITGPDAIMGSPLYMSPEQLQSTKLVDARTDIWSLGVVLQQLLTGRPPFEADSFMAIGAKIAAGTPTELRAGCPEAPEGLAAVVRRCLEKDPAQRFSSIAELAQALRPYAPQASRVSIDRIARVASAASLPDASADARGGSVATARTRRVAVLVLAGAAAVALGVPLFVSRRAALVTEGALATSPAMPATTTTPATATTQSTATAPGADLPNAASPRVVATPNVTPSGADASAGTSSERVKPPSNGASSSSTPGHASNARARRAAEAAGRTGTRRIVRSSARAEPQADALDPMNPALLSR